MGQRSALPKLVEVVAVPKVNPPGVAEVLPKFKPLDDVDEIVPNVGNAGAVVVTLVGKPNEGFVEPKPNPVT